MEREMDDYAKLISKMAKQFLPSFYAVKEYKDLVQDGWEVFARLKVTEVDKPLTCPFGKALAMQIKQSWLNELKALHVVKKRGGKDLKLISLSDMSEAELDREMSLSCYLSDIMDAYLDLSEEMKTVVQILSDAPSELIELTSQFPIKLSVYKYIKRFKNWNSRSIQKLRSELAVV